MNGRPGILLLAAVWLVVGLGISGAGAQNGLELEAKIPLGEVSGRIDHLAVDLDRHRLFVAELGNDSVSVIDLEQRQVLQRIMCLGEPQGVAYLPALDKLVVANGDNGAGDFFSG